MHDFINSRYVILWGMNNLGANQGLWESRELIEAKKRGCKLVVVDPNFTETAQKADEWLPIRPGADGALALAMCHVIIEGDLFDRDFVSRHCEGFDGFREHLRERGYTPEWAEPITGIEGRPDPAHRARVRDHQAGDVGDLQGVRLLHQRRGRGPRLLPSSTPSAARWTSRATWCSRTGPPLGAPVEIPEDAKAAPSKDPLHVAMGYPLAPDLPNSRLPDAVIDGNPYPVKGLFVQSSNPVMSDPNRGSGEGDVRPPGARGDLRAVHERDRAGERRGAAGDLVLRAGGDPPGHVEGAGGGAVPAGGRARGGGEAGPTRSSRRWPKRWGSAGTSPTRNGRTGASW